MVAVALLVAVLAGCSPASIPPDAADDLHPGGCGVTDPGLSELAEARGISIGTAYRSTFAESDRCYRDVALAEFDSLTTEIGTDAVADLATQHGKDFQLHALIWDPLDQPQWNIVSPTIRALPMDERHRLMTDSVATVVKRYAGRASTVTVVNEAFDQMGHLQPNTWWETTRSDRYIFDAFRAARLADPTATLYYNDHSAETISDKSDAVYDLVRRLRNTTADVLIDGTPTPKPLIDGVGFQGHMLGGKEQQPNISDIETNMRRFADLGVAIRFTELDVRIPVVDGAASVADLDRQRLVFNMMTQVCLNQPACTGLTLWGFTDKRSWITDYPDSFSGYGAATPLDATYRRKPAWTGIADALK
ncbi:MAG: glycoside hydrolase [Mycobacterium sp.]|nr:glycoside hydrolase [Mycobacterium sp.]